MGPWRRVGVLTAVCVASLAGSASAASTWHTYTNAAGSRRYLVEVPPQKLRRPSLVIYLHGCGQSAADVAGSTGFSKAADEQGFIVAYPEQPAGGCWDWFHTADQHRGAGEPSIIAGITEEVARAQRVNPRRISILGASAGAYMANIVAISYPDVYAATGILAGGPYSLGFDSTPDVTGQAIVAEMGPRARPVPVLVMQGTNDNVNPYAAGAAAVQQWLGAYDLLDDHAANGSVSRVPASVDSSTATGTPDPANGHTCDEPCAGGLLGLSSYPYTVAHYADAAGASLLDFWTIYGANHDYTGASGGSYTDATGPSMTDAALAFFRAHPLPGRR
jgi:poly(hydroxyalkanoate) depolymerase family esterase